MKNHRINLVPPRFALAAGLALGISLALCFPVRAQQVSSGWTSLFTSTTTNYTAAVVATDTAGHVYVAGTAPIGSTGHAIATIKYDASSGAPLWTNYYSTSSESPLCAIKTDSAGNIYVAASTLNNSTVSQDYTTISYSPSGTQRWVSKYNIAGGSDALPHALTIDPSGYVLVTGRSWPGQPHYNSACATVKYNAATGAGVWTNWYQAHAMGNAVAVDASGNVYVAGQAIVNTSYDYLLVKYAANGTQTWLRTYDGPAGDTGNDEATALALDSSNNIYVTGYMGGNPSDMYGTLKYDSNGNLGWSDVMSYARIRGHATTMALTYGYLFVSGTATGQCLTVKFDTGGSRVWTKAYSTPGSGSYTPSASLVDAFGNLLVTGTTLNSNPSDPMKYYHYQNASLKCDGQSGTLLWTNLVDGWYSPSEYSTYYDNKMPSGLALDSANNFYVAGTSQHYISPSYYTHGATWQFVQTYPPANDQCAGAIALANGVTYTMNTLDATSTGDPFPTCRTASSNGVWFAFTPATDGAVQIYTCGSGYDTVLQVYTGTCGSLAAVTGGCNDDSNACDPDYLNSYVSFVGTAGTTYRILAAGYHGYTGDLAINASVLPVLVTSDPVGGTANAGDSFTFGVTAMGPPGLTYQWQFGGNNLSGATSSTLTLTNLYPGNAGDYQVIVSNSNGGYAVSGVATLAVQPALDLATETPGLTWTTAGGYNNYGWYRQTDMSNDGVDSAECEDTPPVAPYGNAWMQTSVTGPGTLTYYWKFYVPLHFPRITDYLGFYMDGVYQAGVGSSFVRWYSHTAYVGSGSHTLKWSYVRGSGAHGGGPGYVDQVSFSAGSTPALISNQPDPQTAVAGTDATFSVQAGGTPPLRYQWRFYGTNLAGATDSALTLTSVMPVQAGDYKVVVTNDYGPSVTSSVAALTVTTIPLPEALDYLGPAYTTSGNASWFGQVGLMHDGVDAARSGSVGNSQQSVLSLNLLGPGNLSFWWKVSSETNFDYLKFYTNNVLQKAICGEVDWQQQTVSLPAGMNTVIWQYLKDYSISLGQDAAWLDQISYDGPPYLSISPLTPQQVMLYWPTSAIGFGLQSATNLARPTTWQSVTNVPVVQEYNWVVTNNATSRQFYRLKK